MLSEYPHFLEVMDSMINDVKGICCYACIKSFKLYLCLSCYNRLLSLSFYDMLLVQRMEMIIFLCCALKLASFRESYGGEVVEFRVQGYLFEEEWINLEDRVGVGLNLSHGRM